jgi:hypothetical protein
MNTTEILERRLTHARARRDSQPAYSAGWDAASGAIDELTCRLAVIAILARTPATPVLNRRAPVKA